MGTRVLGRSGIKVSAIGFGCWAIGGPFTMGGKPDGWGEVDDRELNVFADAQISEAERDGRLSLHGARAAAGRFTRMFPVAPPLR
jgi:hypothetical protein